MKPICFIAARGGSKGVRRKNIRLLGNKPLIAHTIEKALDSNIFSSVIISTEDNEIARISKKFGAEVPFIRPDLYSSDTSTDREFLIHAMNWLNDNENKIPEYWVHLRPTTPLRNIEVIDKAIESIKSDKKSTSLRSGHIAPESPLKWLKKN